MRRRCHRGVAARKGQIVKVEFEQVLPGEIEKRSFEIISEELKWRGISIEEPLAPVVKRVIHTTADFDYAETMTFSDGALEAARQAIREGACIVTDTRMAMSGINKRVLAQFGGEVYNFMADPDVAEMAKKNGTTRAVACMDRAAQLQQPFAKELIRETDVPYMVARGRKGGSNVAAAICNAVLYQLRDEAAGK